MLSTDITKPINFYEIIYLELVDIFKGSVSFCIIGVSLHFSVDVI